MKHFNFLSIIFIVSLFSIFIIAGCEKDKEEEEPPPPIPELNITETDGNTIVSEDGLTDTFSLTLNTQPKADVLVTIATDGQTIISLKETITFTPTDWNVPQAITVTAIDDNVPKGDHISIITHELTSTDTDYDGETIEFEVTILDNEHTRILAGSRAGHYCVVDPVTGEDLAEPAPDIKYVGQMSMGYMSHKALILSPVDVSGGTPVIYTCDALTGNNLTQITSENEWYVMELDGSPVEPKIAFSAKDIINWYQNIHVINEDGSGFNQLTFYEEGIECPSKVSTKLIGADKPNWSPNGSKIACEVYLREINTNYPHNSVLIMDNNGSNKTVLYDEPVEDTWYEDICWTRDGQFLIFSVDEGSIRAVKALNISTKIATDLHAQMDVGGLGIENLRTSPLENKIVYMLHSPGGADLYYVTYQSNGNVFQITGSPVKLTDEVGVGHGYQQPDWAEWDGIE